MQPVATLILDAWERIVPSLRADPTELARRLARRRAATLMRPPRAWCLAIRASDTRLAGWADCRPGHALRLNHRDHPYRHAEHDVIVTARTLRALCRSVRIEPPGEPWTDVAAKLGCSHSSLRYAMDHGVFEIRHIQNLGGKFGPPIPMLYTREPLDPQSSRLRRPSHPIWGGHWTRLADSMPGDFEQVLARAPAYVRDPRTGVARFRGWHWICPACRRQVRLLYCPTPPLALPDYLNLDPTTLRPRRRVKRPPRKGGRSRSIHSMRDDPRKWMPTSDSPDTIERAPMTFACYECHRIRVNGPSERGFWNHLIGWYTGGLLYGREVRKPDWFKPLRQYDYKPQLNRPSPRRDEALRHLLSGMSIGRIAREMRVGIRAVCNHVRALCTQERVSNRHALVRKLAGASAVALPLNQDERARERRKKVLRRLLRGDSYRRIMKGLSLDFSAVNRDAMKIYKTHGVSGRKGLAKKLGVTLPGEGERKEIESRLRDGQGYNQIAREMGLSRNQVHAHAKRIYRALRADGALAPVPPRRPGGGVTCLRLATAKSDRITSDAAK